MNSKMAFTYYILLMVMFYVGIVLLTERQRENRQSTIKFKKSVKKNLLTFMSDLNSKDADQIFRNVGITLSMKKFIAIRNLILTSIIGFAILSFIGGNIMAARKLFICGVIVYILTYPKEYVFGRKTPFKWILNKLRIEYLNKKDDELLAVITQFKNLTAIQNEQRWSSDYIMQNLMRFTKVTNSTFAHTLTLMRLSKTKEACEYFKREIETRLGDDFSMILSKLDELNPSEFSSQLELFLNNVKEQRKTRQLKRQETISHFVFILASVEISIIFVDFMFIVLFDTMKIMKI